MPLLASPPRRRPCASALIVHATHYPANTAFYRHLAFCISDLTCLLGMLLRARGTAACRILAGALPRLPTFTLLIQYLPRSAYPLRHAFPCAALPRMLAA